MIPVHAVVQVNGVEKLEDKILDQPGDLFSESGPGI